MTASKALTKEEWVEYFTMELELEKEDAEVFGKKFESGKIRKETLISLNHEDLKELGIGVLGDRKLILGRIKEASPESSKESAEWNEMIRAMNNFEKLGLHEHVEQLNILKKTIADLNSLNSNFKHELDSLKAVQNFAYSGERTTESLHDIA